MSQVGPIEVPIDPDVATSFVTDMGVAIPIANVLELLGDMDQGVSSSASGNTVTYTVTDATEEQKGVVELATDAEAIASTDTSKAIVPSSLSAKLGDQTANSVPYGQGTSSAIGWTTALTDGQLVIGANGAAPAAGSLTSAGGTIDITVGANSINLETSSEISIQFDTDSGSAVPAAGILDVLGGTLLGTTGAGNTVTINADDNVVGSVITDSGTATPTSNAFTIAGGTGCATAGATSIVTVNLDAEVPLSFPTDSGTATPAANALTVSGGTNINTAGAAADVTVNLDTTLTGLTSVTSTTFLGTTFDTNVAAAGVTLAGTTLAADGTDTNIDIEITPKGTGVLLTSAIGNAADTTAIAITAAGEVNFPLTPTFLTYLATSEANATGDGTLVAVGATAGYTEVIDQGGNFSGTSFTSPVAGDYELFGSIFLGVLGASHNQGIFQISTSNRSYSFYMGNVGAMRDSGNQLSASISHICDMDASDTAALAIQVSGSTKTVSIGFSSALNPLTIFSGSLQS